MSGTPPAGKSAKTGRKGDARMHKAVASRLANPELTLFEALRVGGFDYAADEDASIVDSEKVTLGQRKNQLSRRLRLARKQQGEGQDGDQGGRAAKRGSGTDNEDGAGAKKTAGSAATLSSEAQKQLEKLMQHSQQAKLTSGVKRNAAEQLQPPVIGPSTAAMQLSAAGAAALDGAETEGMEDPVAEANERLRTARFHPQYQPLFIPRAASVRNTQFGSFGTPQLGALASPRTGPLSVAPSLGGTAGAGGLAGGLSGGFTAFLQPSSLLGQPALAGRSAVSQLRSGPPPSGVAVASLSATAQSVGLTLEQLAVALASSSNLVKVLSSNSNTEQQNQEMAMRLFRNESRALYQRCMLLAGFRPEDADESSQTHLQFAFSAWQMEGKRLQELMGDETMDGFAAANAGRVVDAAGDSKMPARPNNEPTGGHSHDHGHGLEHGHDHGHAGGNHVHQLEGKCGHKAIIHQPEGGSAHIDFVVGNKVECYGGIQPIGKAGTYFPSKYKCQDLSCPTECADQLLNDETPFDFDSNNRNEPKIFDLSDIDLAGGEWNSDVNGLMGGTVLGLFKLSGDAKSNCAQQSAGGDAADSDLGALSI